MWYRVAFEQVHTGIKLIKDQDECELSDDGRRIKITLSQKETLMFSEKYNVRIQVRFGDDISVCATNIADISIGEILDEEVI